MRCSWVNRLDQTPGIKYFSGSGLPIPLKGSRMIASMRSNALSASFRSVSTQKRRSSMNSFWNTAVRAALLKVHLVPQGIHRQRLGFVF